MANKGIFYTNKQLKLLISMAPEFISINNYITNRVRKRYYERELSNLCIAEYSKYLFKIKYKDLPLHVNLTDDTNYGDLDINYIKVLKSRVKMFKQTQLKIIKWRLKIGK